MSTKSRSKKSRTRSRSIGANDIVTPIIETPVFIETRRHGVTPPHKAVAVAVGAVYGIFLVTILVFSIIFLTKLHTYTVNGTKVLNTEDGKVLYGGLITAVIISILALLVAVVTGRGIGTLLLLVAFVANVLVLVYMKKLWDKGATNGKKLMKNDLSAKFVFWGLVANFVLGGLLIVVSLVHDKKENLI